MKAAAAISQGEPNIVFTGYLTGESRMMIYRNVQERLAAPGRISDTGIRIRIW